jgi:hypothetical protein
MGSTCGSPAKFSPDDEAADSNRVDVAVVDGVGVDGTCEPVSKKFMKACFFEGWPGKVASATLLAAPGRRPICDRAAKR